MLKTVADLDRLKGEQWGWFSVYTSWMIFGLHIVALVGDREFWFQSQSK